MQQRYAGAKVHQIRTKASKIQAGTYLLTSIIRKENGDEEAEKKTQELYKKVATLREENQNLKMEMEELKKQMESLHNLYADDKKRKNKK